MFPDHNALNIYTDGSARPTNPGPGGIGVVIEFPEEFKRENETFSEGFLITTNNRMELRACIEALKIIGKNIKEWNKMTGRIRIITDSEYVYNHKNKISEWKRGGKWVGRNNNPILNKDLWKEFATIWNKFSVSIEWTRGKKSEILKQVDKLAKTASQSRFRRKDGGYIKELVCKTMLPGAKLSIYPANNQTDVVIRIQGHKPTNSEYMVKFDLFNEDDNVFEARHYVYTKERLHRHSWYRVSFNKSEHHPVLEKIKKIETKTS